MARNEYDDMLLAEEQGGVDNEYTGMLTAESRLKNIDVKANLMGSVDVNPDNVARARQLSGKMGLPEDIVERNLQQVEAKAKVNEYDALLQESPKLRDQMADRNFARVAIDDLPELSMLERALQNAGAQTSPSIQASRGPRPSIRSIIAGLGRALPQGGEAARQGIRRQFADAIGSESMAADAQQRADRVQNDIFLSTPDFETSTGRAIYGGAASFTRQLPGLAASVITRSPAPALASAGIQTQTESYTKFTGRGATGGEAALGSLGEGAVEVATELLPMSFLTQQFGRAGVGQFLTGLLAREVPGEQAATFLQDAIDTAVANPDKTWQQFLEERPDAAYQTLVSTITQAGITASINSAVTAIAGKEQQAAQADQTAERLAQLSQAVAQTKLIARDPGSFKQFVETATADGPLQDVYIDARTFAQTLEDAGQLEQFARTMPETAAQLDEALALGGDLRIPVAEYATNLAANELNQTLLPHLRTSADGMSQAEAQEFYQTQDEQLREEAERVLAERAEDTAWQQDVATVQTGIMEQLQRTGRFTEDVNRAYSGLMTNFYTVTAQKLGITPSEMAQRYPIRIRAEGAGTDATLDQAEHLTNSKGEVIAYTRPVREAFEKWFEGSKAVDDQGKPLVVYHGTNAEFEAFDPTKADSATGQSEGAMWFTSKKDVATRFGEKTLPVYLSVKNLYEITPQNVRGLFPGAFGAGPIAAVANGRAATADVNRAIRIDGRDVNIFDALEQGLAGAVMDPGLRKRALAAAKDAGADGVVFRGFYDASDEGSDIFAVFDPAQIKSATENRGTYNPNDPNILNQDDPELSRLAPSEQTVLRGIYDTAGQIKPEFDDALRAIAEAVGGSAKLPALKGTRRAVDKIEADYLGNAAKVKDILRGTIEIASPEQAADVVRAIEAHFDVLPNPRNFLTVEADPLDGYRDAKYNVRVGGIVAEIQINVPEILEVKKQQHDNYEAREAITRRATNEGRARTPEELAEIARLNGEMKAAYAGAWERAKNAARSRRAIDTNSLNTASDTGVPLRYADPGSNGRGGSTSQAAQATMPGASNVTGTPSTSRNTVSLENFIALPPFNETIAQTLSNGQLNQTRRGFISFADDITQQASVITLLKDANLSTFLHETGHFFLEVTADIARRPGAPQQIVDDFNKTLAWFGVADRATWTAMSFEEKRPYHEQFARGFEAYLFEGKAPNLEMRGIFQRFRAWLVSIYKTLAELRVELTDEVRGVMDRMLASETDIAEAETARGFAPLFKTQQDAGMTADEWTAYQALGQDATEQAVTDLQRRSLRDMQWLTNARGRALKQLQKDAAGKRKAIRDEVQAEVQAEPVYAAMRFLKRGELQNGDEQIDVPEGNKLSLPALKEMYADDGAVDFAKLGYGQYGMLTDDGLHPDLVAEMFGFTSGDELVRTLLGAEPMNGVVDALTDQRMLERYGDLASNAGIERAANEAVHNDARTRFLATELRQLEKAIGTRKTLIDAAKEYAATMIARRRVRELKPAQYIAAEGRAAKAANKARLAGDVALAAAAKREQLLQNYAAKAALDAVNETEKAVNYLRKFNREGTRKNLDPDYIEQIDVLLERFDLRSGQTLTAIDRRKTLLEWAEAQRALGFEPAIDESLLNEARRKHFRDMTVEEVRGLVDTVRNIEHLGRLKKKLLTAADQREFNAAVEDAARTITDNATKTLPERLENNRFIDRLREGGNEYLAMHRKFASLFRQMDGLVDNGVLWNMIVRPMNGRANQEAVAREQATVKLSELFAPILADGKLREKRFIPEIGKSLSREGRLMIALNWGNETNRLRVLEGERWTPSQAEAILRTITKQEWDFVQSVWNYIDSFWPDIAAKERRVTGNTPEKVQAASFETPHGTYAGGYFPIKYDPTRSSKAEADNLAEAVKQSMQGLYTRATTRRGHTKARTDSVKRPIRKDFGVIFEHVDQVVHDLAWHEWLIDANRLLAAAPIDGAIRTHYGPEVLKTLKDAVKDIAAGDIPASNAFERSINHLRKGVSIAGMGWNLFTALVQPLGLTQSAVRIGPKWVGRGIARWMKDAATMESTVNYIYERSDFMRLRGKTMQREINEIRNTVTTDGKLGPVMDSYFYLIQKAQMIADVPTWIGAYEKATSTRTTDDEAAAIALADQAVLDAQGGGQIKDLAAIQRGSPLLKLWTNFYSYFNVTYNLTAERWNNTKLTKPGEVGRLAVDMLLLYTLPAVLGYTIREAVKVSIGGEEWDEDEFLADLGREQLNYMLGVMVGLRELGSAVQGFNGYNGPAGARFFSEITKLAVQAGQGDVDAPALKALNNAAGILFHYPAGFVQRAVEGFVALYEGDTINPAVLLTGYKQD